MAIVSSPNFLVLSLLICSSISVYGDETLVQHPSPAEAPHPPPHRHHHHHHHPPTPPPSHPPTPPTSPPPAHSPVKPRPSPPPAYPPVKPPPSTPPAHPPVKPPPSTPPAHPPVKPPPSTPPAHPPVKPPTYPPVKPPTSPTTRKMVAVRGVVFCKSCKYRANDTVLGLGAYPLYGAGVKLQCNNTKYGLVEQTKTDKNGYFVFLPQKLTTSGFHKCKVYLVSSPLPKCSVPTNLHGGALGAILTPAPTNKTLPYQFFDVGPFAFAPPKKLPCHY